MKSIIGMIGIIVGIDLFGSATPIDLHQLDYELINDSLPTIIRNVQHYKNGLYEFTIQNINLQNPTNPNHYKKLNNFINQNDSIKMLEWLSLYPDSSISETHRIRVESTSVNHHILSIYREYYYSSQSSNQEKVQYLFEHYNISSGTKITLQQLFNSDSDYLQKITAFINDSASKSEHTLELMHHQNVSFTDFATSLERQFLITKTGLTFNMLYGDPGHGDSFWKEEWFTIPYKKLKSIIDPKGPLGDVLKP